MESLKKSYKKSHKEEFVRMKNAGISHMITLEIQKHV